MEAKLRYLKLGEGQQSGMRAEPSSPMPVPFVPDVAPKTAGTTSTSSSESSCSGRSSLSSSERGSAAMDWRPIPRERAPPLAENLKGLAARATGPPVRPTSTFTQRRFSTKSARRWTAPSWGTGRACGSKTGVDMGSIARSRSCSAGMLRVSRRSTEGTWNVCARAGNRPKTRSRLV